MPHPASPAKQGKPELLSSSPVVPQNVAASSLLRDYLEWFRERELTDDEAWNQDINAAIHTLYSERIRLQKLRGLKPDWFRAVGIKAGIASDLQSRIKEFLKQTEASQATALAPPSSVSVAGEVDRTQGHRPSRSQRSSRYEVQAEIVERRDNSMWNTLEFLCYMLIV